MYSVDRTRLPSISRELAVIACATAAVLALPNAFAADIDLAKVKDPALVSRFAGSKVIGYVQKDFEEFDLPMGKWAEIDGQARFEKVEHVEGRVTRIAYEVPAGKSVLEVYRNYTDALSRSGVTTRFECAKTACGDTYNLSSELQERVLPKLDGDGNRMIDVLRDSEHQIRLLTGHLDRVGAPAADISLMVASGNQVPVGVLLTIVEQKEMAKGQVTVDLKAMESGLAKDGHIALYGIEFDTDSATLRSTSDETLARMGELMKQQPNLKVYIVGHTDNTGTLAHNQTLSQQRADAVAKALSGRFGVAAARLTAKGLASFAPVASNADEAGRARNRRVELVQQ